MKKLFISILVILNLFAMGQEDFTPLISKGQIPDDILKTAAVEYEKDKNTIRTGSSSEKKLKDEFYLKHNYFISDMLKNGYVLFGDEVSVYINQLGKKILSQISDLDGDEIKFYVTKDAEANAFTSQKGFVFVNLGLIAQCENEAQLAFVISHELVHYMKNHGVESYVEKDRIKNSRSNRDLTFDEKTEKYLDYSQDHEFEADKYSLTEIYLKLGYDIEEVLNVFDVLLYSYLPFDEVEFDSAFFNDSFFNLPNDYLKKEINPITAIEDYDDSWSTHPNIKKRRERMIDEIADMDVKEGGAKFLVSESGFKKAQKLARYDICQLLLDDMDYGKAFYTAYLLQQTDKDSKYLLQIQAYALYAISKYVNRYKDVSTESHTIVFYGSNYSQVIRDNLENTKAVRLKNMLLEMDSIKGYSSQLYIMLRKMNKKEMNVIALRQIFKALEKSPDSYFLQQLAQSCLDDLFKINEMRFDNFLQEEPSDSTSSFIELSPEEYAALSKYEKIKYNREKDKYSNDGASSSFLSYGFISYFNNKDSYFKDLFQKAEDKFIENRDEDEDDNDISDYSLNSSFYISSSLDKNKLNSMVMLNPNYSYYKKKQYNFIKSEVYEKDFINIMKETSKKARISLTMLDVYDFKANDSEQYNDLSITMRYYVEHFGQDKIIDNEEIVNSNLAYILSLTEKYETDYFSIAGLTNEQNSRNPLGALVLLSANFYLFPYMLPYTAYWFMSPTNEMEYLVYTINVKTGEIAYVYRKDLPSAKFDHVIKSVTYDGFWEINNQ